MSPEHLEHLLVEIKKIFTAIPFNQVLGLELLKLAPEKTIMRFDHRPELVGNFLQQILHGGVIASVLDMVGGCAVMADVVYKNSEANLVELAAKFGKSSTVDLQVSFLKPGIGKSFSAHAWITHGGSRISFTRMELYNQNDHLIATANGTYLMH